MAVQFFHHCHRHRHYQKRLQLFDSDTIAAFTSAMRVEAGWQLSRWYSFGGCNGDLCCAKLGAGMIGRIRRCGIECLMISLVLSLSLAVVV